MVTSLNHIPVLCDEVIRQLEPNDNKTYLDATFGQGGYTDKILNSSNCCIIAIDRDSDSLKYAKILKKKYKSNFFFKNERFSNIDKVIKKKIDGITFDLGISNTQLNNPKRGFSFMHDGPLDMRMGTQEKENLTAEEIINNFSEKELSEIFYLYGEERNSLKISKEIIKARKLKRISSTNQLSAIINRIQLQKNKKINPSTKVFQALRIYINTELLELETALKKCLKILNKKAKIVVVSFHSLEDRIVKNFFREHSGYKVNNYKHLPQNIEDIRKPILKIITKKTITPSIEEIKANPRARSAKLRAAEIL